MQISQSQINQQPFAGVQKVSVQKLSNLNLDKILKNVNKGDTVNLVLQRPNLKKAAYVACDKQKLPGKIGKMIHNKLLDFSFYQLSCNLQNMEHDMINTFKSAKYASAAKKSDLFMKGNIVQNLIEKYQVSEFLKKKK